MSRSLAGALALALVALAGWGIPALGMRMLVPSLATPERMHLNYRGRSVFVGLGIVWVFWTLGVTALLALLRVLPEAVGHSVPMVLGSAAWLATTSFAFGLIDDAFGTSAEKGLRGHLRALAHGRFTTGALKLVGIGLVSLIAAASARLAQGVLSGRSAVATVVEVVLATMVIAGSSNLLNLLDLRPGRALKSYLAFGLIAWASWCWVARLWANPWAPSDSFSMVALAIALAGPAFAVWRFDLGEKGMLGDAGANPAGAVVGFVLAVSLPAWGLAAAAALVVAANLASEKVSFSAAIERNRLLSWLDSLGRGRDSEADMAAVPAGSDNVGRTGASDR